MARKPKGEIGGTYFCPAPAFAVNKKRKGKRGQGIRYEQMVHKHFVETYPLYLESPWLRYADEQGWHWCQPDAVYIDVMRGVLTIVEVKYQHTIEAWWQLVDLYMPVLEVAFPKKLWKYQLLEVVRWYNPDIRWPQQPKLIAKPFEGNYVYGVHIWKP
jgi:hypothetical protein